MATKNNAKVVDDALKKKKLLLFCLELNVVDMLAAIVTAREDNVMSAGKSYATPIDFDFVLYVGY